MFRPVSIWEDCIRYPLTTVLNVSGDVIRYLFGSGPKKRMNRRLARELVDRGSWDMIPLTSGMQSPTFDAIEYLVKHEDHESVPRLKALFELYSKKDPGLLAESSVIGGIQTFYGPSFYMPGRLQFSAAIGVLNLLPPAEAKVFIKGALTRCKQGELDPCTVRLFDHYLNEYK